jgi:hypothetical protein
LKIFFKKLKIIWKIFFEKLNFSLIVIIGDDTGSIYALEMLKGEIA